jgi:prepilin-type N-terminal cleavage/methylation domain-containing protein
MTNAERMTKHEVRTEPSRPFCHSSFGFHSAFGIRASSFRAAGASAFTLVELLVVMVIILILGGLILATSSYVQTKGKRSRTEAEIAAMSAALENYKADNGVYPRSGVTDGLDVTTTTLSNYAAPNLKLYEYLSGDSDHDRVAETKTYFPFKPTQLSPADQTQPVTAIRDPFGNPFAYSTMKAADSTKPGFNPTFDLWSIADGAPGTDQTKWIKNW